MATRSTLKSSTSYVALTSKIIETFGKAIHAKADQAISQAQTAAMSVLLFAVEQARTPAMSKMSEANYDKL